jgi:cytoskeletal protein RodZ
MGGIVVLLGILLAAGPRPDKKDVPYLVHANTLVQTEVTKPQAADTAEGSRYSVPGETSLARTPLALPIFLLDAAEIQPEKVRLIRLTAKNGHREALMLRRHGPDDTLILLTVTRLGGGLYRFETVNDIENGEYALNVTGTNQFFCFTVF